MTAASLLYPRLDATTARRIIGERAAAGLDELKASAALQHHDAVPAATGGHPVPVDKLAEVQTVIRNAAEAAGYPKSLGGGTQDFDRPCGTALFETMDIVPADAAEEGVWSFITLVLVPEIGPWRFPDQTEERLIGRPRNVLRRLWWRAWALGPDLQAAPTGCRALGEDESVQIMERPSLGGNRRTARALQAALWRAEQAGLSVPRSELMRQLTRRLRAAKSHIALDALRHEEFDLLLDRLAVESIQDLRG
jgi:hypothetical protein